MSTRALRTLLERIDVAEAVRRRTVQEAITAVTADYWLQRAEAFAAVGTPDCDLIATNCRNHARLLSGGFGPLEEPWPGYTEEFEVALSEREAA